MVANARYQYDTNPRKLEQTRKTKTKNKPNLKVIKEEKRQKVKVSIAQKKKQKKLMICAILAFIVLLAISYQNSQISIRFGEMQNQKKELATLQKENEQLKINIENNLNMGNIEKEAKEQLGMEKLTNKQTVYVTLPKKDYVEAANEKIVVEEKTNIFEKITNWILQKIK